MTGLPRPSGPYLSGTVRRAVDQLHDARVHERDGRIPEAASGYEAAIALAERHGESATLSEALRRLAVVRHHRDDSVTARELGRRSYEVARASGDDLLAAEALNTLGGIEMTTDGLADARAHFLQALALGAASSALHARVEQNLGILANIQGDLGEAATRYARSLNLYLNAGDEVGCALAYHNLGMVSADREDWDAADGYFDLSREIAVGAGQVYLQGLCLVNHAEVHVARQRFEDARLNAEQALAIFDRLGAGAERSGAYRVLAVVYRETGRPLEAESRLRVAIDLAGAGHSVLNQAEATRELAVLYQASGRNQEALSLLNTAHRLFARLDARRDLVHVDGKMAELEDTYLDVVRHWGESIESSDRYTFGHCERVARNAVTVARVLGLGDEEQMTIRLGAYLHDVGKVNAPSELLNKPGPLTRAEFALLQRHPIWGIELLAGVEFPWDLKPIVRWHHEKYDGTGYPDELRGDLIPLSAQIVGIVDVYDALTSARPYRLALTPAQAYDAMLSMYASWSPVVFEAFVWALPGLSREGAVTNVSTLNVDSEQAA